MSRWTKSIAAGLLLLALVVGVPVLLVAIAGSPLPSTVPDVENMTTMVRQGNIPSDVVINTIAVVVWLAWLQLMWSVLWELAVNVPKLATGRRWRPPPLVLSPIGDVVARLFSVILAVGVIASATPSETATALTSPSGLPQEPARSSLIVGHAATTTADASDATATSAPQWQVTANDDLWSISEYALGDGSKVDDILAVNPGLTPRSLRAGMLLNLPDGARTAPVENEQPAVPADGHGDAAIESSSTKRYVVQDNDGMWSVAEALLGDGSRHEELYELLAGQEVAPGVVFTADTYVIHPGWVFELDLATSEATPARPVDGAVADRTVIVDESLSSIADDVLGDPDRWPVIFERNAGKVMNDGRVFDDPNLIMPGWVLELPVAAPSVPADAPLPGDASVAANAPAAPDDAPPGSVEPRPEPTAPAESIEVVEAADMTELAPTMSTAPASPTTAAPVESGAPEPDDTVAAASVPLPVPAQTPTPVTTAAAPVAPSTAAANGAVVDAVELTTVRDWRTVWMVGLSGATVLASGLWALARWYRRRASARGGTQVREYNESSQMIDDALRTSADAPLLSWANVALAELVAERGRNNAAALPVAVTLSAERGVGVRWEPPLPAVAVGQWAVLDDGTTWQRSAPDVVPVVVAGPAAIPGLVTVGAHEGESMLVDLESCGSLALKGDAVAAEALIRSIVLELGTGGVLSNCQVHTVGLDVDGSEQLGRVRSRTESEAVEHLRTIRVQNDAVLGDAQRSSMLEVRSASSPLGREVHVVAVRASACERLHELIETAAAQRGVALIVLGDADCAATLTIDTNGGSLEPLGLRFEPAGMPRQTAAALAVHMERVSASVEAEPASPPAAVERPCGDPLSEPAVLVRVLGSPSVDGASGLGHREIEVAAFTACSGPSTDDEVSDAVFCGRVGRSELWNLLSGIRAEAPTLLAPRTEGGNDIALADGVISDVQWMSHLVFRSHSRDDDEAIDDLVEALNLVTGVPFSASTGFDWASASGDFAGAYELIERCGYVLASRAIEAERFTAARSALESAIAVLGANEPLTQSLMRLEAAAGDADAVESAYGDLSQGLAFISDARTTVEPAPSTTVLLTEPTSAKIDTSVEPTVAPVRHTVRPRVLLRTMGDVCAEGATTTQALAAAFVVASKRGAMPSREVAELTSYSAKSLSTVFTSSNELLSRENGELALRDGVWTDHGWMLECARRAQAAARSDDVYDMSDWLRSLFAELARVEAGPFASVPSKKAYWAWVDEFPPDVPARNAAETELVEATLIGITVWRDTEAGEHLPADVLVKTACKIAGIAPYAPVADSIRPAEMHTAAECLLIAAHRVAGGRTELTNTVITRAHDLVSNGMIEASDELADALGL